MARLICLGGSIESLPILQRIRELGYALVVVDGNKDAPGRQYGTPLLASCYHSDKAIKALKGLNIKYDAVLCAAIDAPVVAAAVAREFGLPGLTVEQAELGADKVKQGLALARASIPAPRLFEPRHPFPVDFDTVVKPVDSRGGRGVSRVPGGQEPDIAYEHARSQSPTGRVMVEEWLDGPQLSTESLVQDGKVLFTAIGLRNYSRLDEFAPACIEDGFLLPSPENTLWMQDKGKWSLPQGEITKIIENSCRALDWFQTGGGVVKGDIVIHDKQAFVIELAPRLSGGLFCAAHQLAYGVDFIGSAINAALGYTLDMPTPYPRQFVSQRYLFPDKSEVGKCITRQGYDFYTPQGNQEGHEGKGVYKTMLGLVFSHYSKPSGHVIEPVTCHADRLGQAMCVGKTPQEARERAEQAVRAMKNGMVIE